MKNEARRAAILKKRRLQPTELLMEPFPDEERLRTIRPVNGDQLLCALLLVAWGTRFAFAQPAAETVPASPSSPTLEAFLLGPPQTPRPVVVRASFHLHDINEIDDEAETFEFTGVLTLQWCDERQAFDPVVAGVNEKVFQGDYQFNEISPGWFPQEVLVNESGTYEKHGVVLRVRPDGTQTLIQTVNAAAKAEFDMRRFPFDRHRLDAIFEVLGFDNGEVVLEVGSEVAGALPGEIRVPQWSLSGVSVSTPDHPAPYAGRRGTVSAFVVSVEARREPFYIVRLVVLPLAIIVLLSFSVFWMDRSSLGDRINVSFIGILTGVAYQIVMSDLLPRISYFTLMNAFLNISFLTMCATVVINLVVGALDQQRKSGVGDRIDRRCRWTFPLCYFGLNALVLAIALAFY